MTNEQIQELQRYADMEGTELGEYVNLIIALIGRSDCASDEFMDHVLDEAETLLNEFKTNYRIEEREITQKRTIRELIYKDDYE